MNDRSFEAPAHEGGWDARRYLLRELPADAAACLGIALFLTVLFSPFFSAGSLRAWLQSLLFNSIISLGIGLMLANLYRFLQGPLLRRFPGRPAYWLTHLLLTGGGVVLGVEIANRVVFLVGGPAPAAVRLDVLRLGLVVGAVAVAANVVYDRLRDRAHEVELKAEQAKKEALRADLRALQARTDPHFLFNSLNTVAGLIEEDPRAAERVLERLSSLFRYALKGSQAGWVRLDEELAAVKDYLAVEEIRLGDRLRAEIDVPAAVGKALVPPLLLQPLVENAVLHAIVPRREGGRLRISASRVNGALSLTVADDGPGPGNSQHRGSGTSVSDLRQRLEITYGGRAALDVGEAAGGGYRVAVTLPLQEPTA